MDLSIFLAKALGIYLLIMGMAMVLNRTSVRAIVFDMTRNPSLLFLTGVMALIIGILMVLSHNLWVMDWRVLVTIMGWLSLIKGSARVLFPAPTSDLIQKWTENDKVYSATIYCVILIGILFIYWGLGW